MRVLNYVRIAQRKCRGRLTVKRRNRSRVNRKIAIILRWKVGDRGVCAQIVRFLESAYVRNQIPRSETPEVTKDREEFVGTKGEE